MRIEREGCSNSLDDEIWQSVEKTIQKNHYMMRDILEPFPIYVRRLHLARFLARYELYRMVQDLPGCIFECGVYRGAGLMTWAKIMEILSPGDRSKKVYGFDHFQGIGSLHEKDGIEKDTKALGRWDSSFFYQELQEHIRIFELDSYVPRAPRIELVEGDLSVSAPQFVLENSGVRICLLNIDVDVYEPSFAALEHFYPLVVPGGLVVLDEFGVPSWGGEAKAFDDYFADKFKPRLSKLPFSSLPGAFFVKE